MDAIEQAHFIINNSESHGSLTANTQGYPVITAGSVHVCFQHLELKVIDLNAD